MTSNATQQYCEPAACENPLLFNVGEGCDTCTKIVPGCNDCEDSMECSVCKDGFELSRENRCYMPYRTQNYCFLTDLEGSVISEQWQQSLYLVVDGCLRSLDNIRTANIYGANMATYKVYPYGTIAEQDWPLGPNMVTMELVSYQDKYYMVIDGVAREFDKVKTASKYGYELNNAVSVTGSTFNRFDVGTPITWHAGVSSATYGWEGKRLGRCWMRFEEGKRFSVGRKIYFIMDGCARELVGDSDENLFSNDMNIHELTDTFFEENDWHIYLQVGDDTQLVQIDGESNYWLIINAEKREIRDQEVFDEYDFDVEKVLSITHE
jgi:hypothetical protein